MFSVHQNVVPLNHQWRQSTGCTRKLNNNNNRYDIHSFFEKYYSLNTTLINKNKYKFAEETFATGNVLFRKGSI